jgi:membrane protease YdiL (CAAX protease family)
MTDNEQGAKMTIGPFAVLFGGWCLFQCVLIPVVAEVQKKRTKMQAAPPLPDKRYSKAAVRTILFAIFALITAFEERIPLSGVLRLNLKIILLATAFLLLNMAYARFEWACAPIDRKIQTWNFLPHTPKERVRWLFYSLVIGGCEEIIYRGVLFGVMFKATENYLLAGLISAVFFTVAHLSQGWKNILSLPIVAIGLQWLVQVSGGLYVAIAVHLIYNAANGIAYGAKALSKAAVQQHTNADQFQLATPLDDSAKH